MSFEKNLENLRKQKGWSQDDLADKLNLTRQAISKWETGTSKPDIDNIKNISQLFSVSIDELLNNDVVEDKAVTLDVRKKEKRESTIKTIKFIIIALVIVYLISVIYKFASLLVIVNGVQQYANLNNYHYVITTYDENGLAEKEECWYKDGVSKTVSDIYKDNDIEENSTFINYETGEGKIYNVIDNSSLDIKVDDYLATHLNYNNGGQLYSSFPTEIKINSPLKLIVECLAPLKMNILVKDNCIDIITDEYSIKLDKTSLMPESAILFGNLKNEKIILIYHIELNTVQEI